MIWIYIYSLHQSKIFSRWFVENSCYFTGERKNYSMHFLFFRGLIWFGRIKPWHVFSNFCPPYVWLLLCCDAFWDCNSSCTTQLLTDERNQWLFGWTHFCFGEVEGKQNFTACWSNRIDGCNWQSLTVAAILWYPSYSSSSNLDI